MVDKFTRIYKNIINEDKTSKLEKRIFKIFKETSTDHWENNLGEVNDANVVLILDKVGDHWQAKYVNGDILTITTKGEDQKADTALKALRILFNKLVKAEDEYAAMKQGLAHAIHQNLDFYLDAVESAK